MSTIPATWRPLPSRLFALESRLRPLPARSGTVSRTGLVNQLRAASDQIVVIVAPPGYGKTTLLSQWIEREARLAAWVSVQEEDNDPAVFLTHVAAALDYVLEIERSVFDALAAQDAPTLSTALPLLTSALSSAEDPVVVVLDDVDQLESRASVRALAALAEHIPSRSTLALAGRGQPRLPIARLRTKGCLFELGMDELAMSGPEARSLLRGARANVSEEQIADLARRTEGWPAGLHLAALSLEGAGPDAGNAVEAFCGDDRFVADYLRLEVLSTLTDAEISFLTRTSVLDTFCQALCDAVLGRRDSAVTLRRLEQSSQFLVSLDRRRGWYRFHRLFRDALRAELERREPDAVPVLTKRAADWCERNGLPEPAIQYAHAAGDTGRAARLVRDLWFQVYDSGRIATVAQWLDWLDEDRLLKRYPVLAVAGAWVRMLTGRPSDAERWLETAERSPARGRGSGGSVQALLALARAAMCKDGVTSMRADAEVAVRELAPRSPCRSSALLLLAVSYLLSEEDDEADSILADVAEQSSLPGGAVAASVALAERAMLASGRHDYSRADAFGHRGSEIVSDNGLGHYVTSALVYAVEAHRAARRGDLACVRRELARAVDLLPELDYAVPWLAAQTRLELARVDVAIADETAAETLLTQVDEVLQHRPRLGTLVDSVRELQQQIAGRSGAGGRWASSLTTAELRLIPLLATHLSFREIAERLFVSRNTVKTQAISVYRKLGVSSRSEAIARAADLGLVGEPAVPAAENVALSG